MAQTQVKPTSSGAFTNYTGKATVGLPAHNGMSHKAQLACNLFATTQGVASTRTTMANKSAAAVGVLLQWA